MLPGGSLARVEAPIRIRVAAEAGRSLVPLKPFIVLYAGLGETDRAFEYLEQACRVHDPMLFHVPMTPACARLRADPRFRALVDCLPVFEPCPAIPANSLRPGSAFPRS